MVKKISINPNYSPKPITEGEVWQGHPLFPNELRDENEKLLIVEEVEEVEEVELVTTRELQDELLRQAAEAADKRVREIFKGE